MMKSKAAVQVCVGLDIAEKDGCRGSNLAVDNERTRCLDISLQVDCFVYGLAT